MFTVGVHDIQMINELAGRCVYVCINNKVTKQARNELLSRQISSAAIANKAIEKVIERCL